MELFGMWSVTKSWLFGRVSLVFFGAVMVFWTPAVSSQLQTPLAPTSVSFEAWREQTAYLECYLFNITNVAEILAGKNVSIRVEQLGPYVYRETEIKTNISWHDNTVEFYNQRYWHFEPHMSNGSLSDEIVSINPVIVTMSHRVRDLSMMFKIVFDVVAKTFHKHMFLTADVSSWLFDGIYDPLLNITAHLPNSYEKFGWFYQRNGSLEYDGSFLMNTGAADINKLGDLEKWKFSDRTVYRGTCGEVKGSTGEPLAPEIGRQKVTIFTPDICTYIVLPKDKEVVEEGIEGIQYAADATVFDNGHTVPEMACYCAEVRDRDCLPSGTLNVSACRYGAPAFVSLPHFLHSDPYYPSKIEGLNPTEDMNFRITLENSTGKPLSVAEQLQMNLLVRHVSGVPLYNQLPDPDVLVPMFWYKREVRNAPTYSSIANETHQIDRQPVNSVLLTTDVPT